MILLLLMKKYTSLLYYTKNVCVRLFLKMKLNIILIIRFQYL